MAGLGWAGPGHLWADIWAGAKRRTKIAKRKDGQKIRKEIHSELDETLISIVENRPLHRKQVKIGKKEKLQFYKKNGKYDKMKNKFEVLRKS